MRIISPEELAELAAEKREKEHCANLARLRARLAEGQKKEAALRAELEAKKLHAPKDVHKVNAQATPVVESKGLTRTPSRYVAVHEAGHVVCSKRLGVPVIKAKVGGDNSGEVVNSEADASCDTALPPDLYKIAMLVLLSGAAAEFIDNRQQFSRNVENGFTYSHDARGFFELAYKHLAVKGASCIEAFEDAIRAKSGHMWHRLDL
jgi:hypothetical protein